MKFKLRRLACAGLTAVMAVSFTAGNVLALANSKESGGTAASGTLDAVSFEDVTGQLDVSSIVLQNLSAQVLENAGYTVKNDTRTVIVTLDGDSVIESMPEGESASEYITSYSGSKALKRVNGEQTNFLNSLSSLGVEYEVIYQYSAVTNAIALEVNTEYLSTIKSIAGVSTASVSETYAVPETTTVTSTGGTINPSNVYATGIYDSEEIISDYGVDGSGMTVAILDTGLDYTHEAFSVMPETVGFTKDYVSGKLSMSNAVALSKQNGKTITANDVYINEKVPFAYDYADEDTEVYPSYSQHGTHVAGIIAGQADSYTDKDGNIATDSDGNTLSFRGVAPNAQLVICKVFTDDLESDDIGGATSEDILAALEDCVLLGVDIINMSLGTTAGFSSLYLDGDDEGQALARVYKNIKDVGISLICAASNDFSSGYGSAFGTNLASNPDSGTVGSPSTFDGAVSVASINGQTSPFMMANGSAIFYTEASDANSVKYNFAEQILGGASSKTFKYVVIPGIGQAGDYTANIQNLLKDKAEGEKVIAVIKRGTTTFEDKVEIATSMGADAVIIYNNVAGTVGMSLGDLEDPIPAVSVSMDAGKALCYDADGNKLTYGYIEVNTAYEAGPFMNEYSSWGSTPSLGLKPDVTAHGGEITSTVSGGYAEMSGTSMATPNLAGFVALLKSYLKQQNPDLTATELTRLTNQIIMSTATTVYDQEGLPYSPRKQGSGLATLSNAFSTGAYLYTIEGENNGAEDNRPKIELGADEDKEGVYELVFYVCNFGTEALTFKTQSIFMTETLSSDGLSVAEKAYLLDDIAAKWIVNGKTLTEGDSFTVAAGQSASINVTLTLSEAEKNYLDTSFENGMYVEGFIKLLSDDAGQCDLTLPFMGFYGDWYAAPMLDYDCFEIAESEKDTSLDDDEKLQPMVWATQAYGTYYDEKYSVPLGNFLYLQDENAEQIYTEAEHAAISRYNYYYGEDSLSNYMTSTSIKALYAGLLRNAELVTYDLYDAYTGELLKQDCVYRVSKAYAGGGSTTPAQVLLELYPDDLGLVNNGKYQLEFHFYMKEEDASDPEKQNDDNTFSMIFYVDYEAPILVDSRIRYYDYKDGTKDKQRVYLDLDVYDNHYAQSVILCYVDDADSDELKLATEYVTPIYNAAKNGTTTVSIDITDFYEQYKDRLYVQLDDYALNHKVYRIIFSSATSSALPDTFEIDGDTEITIGLNEAYKVSLDYEGSANLSNFTWTAVPSRYVLVKNGEIFGAAVGTSIVTVSTGSFSRQITVHVVDNGATLTWPSISFGTIENSGGSIVKASGMVKVNAGSEFELEINPDPWYYPVSTLSLSWTSSNPEIASVDGNGVVHTYDTKGTAVIKATIMNGESQTAYSASVILSVQDPFTVSNYTLTDYHGTGGVVKIPDDMNIMYIGEEAFKDNDNIEVIIIPKTVTTIKQRAFVNCTALEEVYFIQQEALAIADADLSMIEKHAFYGCSSLVKVDLTNVKTITLDKEVFYGCTNLQEVVKMQTIGTMNDMAFAGCTSLLTADITGLHMSGSQVFAGCTSLKEVETAYYTAIGEAMFYGCTALKEITINTPTVAEYAFYNCSNLQTVNFGVTGSRLTFNIGAMAFYNCNSLSAVNFNGNLVSAIGDMAFANCAKLTQFALTDGDVQFGDRVFYNTPVTVTVGSEYTKDGYGAIYKGTTLVLAPKEITSSFAIKSGTTEIGAYAFSGCTLTGVTAITIPEAVTKIDEGAFAYSGIKSITLPSGVTQIADYAFSGSLIETITIPSRITYIGEGAFSECANLKTVTFESSSLLERIGDGAFYACTALTTITLPDGVSVMGDSTFYGCTRLKEVVLPSVKELGAYTFVDCPALTTVTFGANAAAAGSYTFFPGGIYEYDASGNIVFNANTSSLTRVALSDKMTELGANVFSYCTALNDIDLKNITVIGEAAFANCTALTTVTGLDKVTEIADYAFANTALTALDLQSARTIGAYAFSSDGGNAAYKTVSLPVVTTIGMFAFYGGGESEINLPLSLKSLGYGAFTASKNLTAINVTAGNGTYFSEDGVLYRYVIDFTAEDTVQYEICAYPSARVAELVSGVKTYSIKEGTVSVMAYAFAELNSKPVEKVVFPYSIKVIGDSAFYAGGISEYRFECINAPVLQTYYFETGIDMFYSLFYLNFEDDLLGHLTDIVTGATESKLTISYPENGVGYDNYIFTNYFGKFASIGEIMDDTTRALKALIESFVSAETIGGWNSLDVNDENRAMVVALSENVKEAHGILNNITDAFQLECLGEDNVKKLTEIESALKTVKERFGIAASVASLSVSADSNYKSDYKEGERFDTTGLKILVTYDDYSTEVIDETSFTLSSAYAGELTTLNRYVVVQYAGKSVMVAITVTGDTGSGSGDGAKTSSGCGAVAFGEGSGTGGGLIALGLVALTLVACLAIRKKRRKAD